MYTTITDEQVKAAAMIIAHRDVFAASKWAKYEDVARSALEAAALADKLGAEAAYKRVFPNA